MLRAQVDAKKESINKKKSKVSGFTIVELLVVVSIIGLLASIVMISIKDFRARARDTIRISNIKALQNVLHLYYNDNGEYPKTFDPGTPLNGRAFCEDGQEEYIPGVSAYVAQLPTDPILDCDGPTHAWVYASNGVDYKLITHNETQYGDPVFIDPAWDEGPDDCILDGSKGLHYGVWTPGASCWEL